MVKNCFTYLQRKKIFVNQIYSRNINRKGKYISYIHIYVDILSKQFQFQYLPKAGNFYLNVIIQIILRTSKSNFNIQK